MPLAMVYSQALASTRQSKQTAQINWNAPIHSHSFLDRLNDVDENCQKYQRPSDVSGRATIQYMNSLYFICLFLFAASILLTCGQTSLADELNNTSHVNVSAITQRTLLTRKCGYLLDEDSSPDHSVCDVDSGHSTAHSPTDFKSLSPQLAMSPTSQSPFPPPFGGVPYSQLEMLEATHRGLHKFIPRHHDEIDVEIGDPIYVQKEADDLWCEGVNLRTGRQGIFPSAYAVDLDYNDFDPTAQKVKKERYLLGYLGSVETTAHKGTGVVCQAVRKIVGERGESPNAQICILEISDQGLRMVERASSVCSTTKDVSLCFAKNRNRTKKKLTNNYNFHVFRARIKRAPASITFIRSKMYHFVHFIRVIIGILALSQNTRPFSDSLVMYSKVKSLLGQWPKPSGKFLNEIHF